MIPIEKVQDIVAKHDNLEQELSSGKIDAKLFAKKSKEYSSLKNIVSFAREFINFDSEIKDLEQIIQDQKSGSEKVMRVHASHASTTPCDPLKEHSRMANSRPHCIRDTPLVPRGHGGG